MNQPTVHVDDLLGVGSSGQDTLPFGRNIQCVPETCRSGGTGPTPSSEESQSLGLSDSERGLDSPSVTLVRFNQHRPRYSILQLEVSGGCHLLEVELGARRRRVRQYSSL